MFLLLALLSIAPPALAWGPTAHRAAASVAESRLCMPARGRLRDLLGAESLAQASVWPDTIRREAPWRHTGPWHYADLEDADPVRLIWRGDRGRLFIALEEQLAILANEQAPRDVQRDALRFVAHLVVDAHQPLHVGRPGDRGGNEIRVRLGERQTSLHQAWDSGIIGRMGLGWEDLAKSLAAMIRPGLVTGGGSFEDWAAESLDLRPWVYDFQARSTAAPLSRRYEATARQVAVVRLAQAALRLESTLEGIWCPGGHPDFE